MRQGCVLVLSFFLLSIASPLEAKNVDSEGALACVSRVLVFYYVIVCQSVRGGVKCSVVTQTSLPGPVSDQGGIDLKLSRYVGGVDTPFA